MYSKKLGIIDLSKKKIKITRTSEALQKQFLGGRGLNSYYLYKMIKTDIDPFSPENIIIFGTGLLTGTLVPNSSRFNVSAKSPETGILGDSNCGGYFAAELRYAGFDRLIIHGKAPKPSYLYVSDGNIEIKEAKDYWGMDTTNVQQSLRHDLGHVEAAVCGVAGEKLVRFACVRTGVKNAAGRCGLGAVMGSKNLKAIAAKGTQGIEIVHPEEMLETVQELKDYIMNSKIISILGSVGTPLLYEVSNTLGAIRTKNSQLNAWSESLNAEVIETYVEKMISCSSCIVHCRHRNKLGGEGPEYTAVGLLGANLGLDNTANVIELNNICNELGLDISSSGTILSWAFELYEKSIIDQTLTEEPLQFGDFDLVKRLLHKISRREGFGNILAESTSNIKRFGKTAEDYLIAVKGLPQSDPHDCRYIKAFALGIATSSRGADHLRSRPTLEIFLHLPEEVKERIYGKGIPNDPTSYVGKEKTVYFSDNIFAAIDSLGICKFICHGFNSPHFVDYTWMKKLIHCATGWTFNEKNIQEVGKRIIDIERMFNNREGITRKNDTLPKRYFDDPMPLNIAKGHHIDRKEFDTLLSRYYKLRSWTPDGLVKKERINELESLQ
ncbi:MAG: aldehyde ferredoxin oxidoreductase family protein [Candidatus Thermoplasmatota archaeon]|nr:aldehyde ferredoxin oxidoreductase family protein [Candidatus Thermoplasmatota archaeon]MBU1940437.1 aldehyde ferredoxin oxidoreductase family protein [Candidatus Thermoplasmatota archaeon]